MCLIIKDAYGYTFISMGIQIKIVQIFVVRFKGYFLYTKTHDLKYMYFVSER